MNIRSFAMLGLSAALGLATFTACERRAVVIEVPATPVPEPVAKTTTFETERLGKEIELFDREPTSANKAAVKKAFAKLDGEIAELEERVAKTGGRDRSEAAAKLKNLQSYRASESVRFTALEAKAAVTPGEPAPVDDRSGGRKIKDDAKEAGASIKDAAKEIGRDLKDAVPR